MWHVKEKKMDADDRMEGDWPHPVDQVHSNNFNSNNAQVYTTNTSSNVSSSEYYALIPSTINQTAFDGGQMTASISTPQHLRSSNFNLFPESSYSSGASSVCPSPGPVKRFRQHYGGATIPKSGTNERRQRYMENWMNSHHNYPSCSTSNTPSIASSNISAISRFSALSIDTQLSVAVDMIDLNMPAFQNDLANSNSSLCENVNPVYFHQMHECLLLISQKLNSFNEIDVNEALNQLRKLATERSFVYCKDMFPLQTIIKQLVCLLRREGSSKRSILVVLNKMTYCNICLTALSRMSLAESQDFVHSICTYLHPNEPYFKCAINIFDNLLRHVQFGRHYQRIMRTKDFLDRLMVTLRAKICDKKCLCMLLYMVRLTINPKEFKWHFVQSGGMEFCLEMFTELVDEKTLNQVVLLLHSLVTSDSDHTAPVVANHFVQLGGIQTLATRLDHGSPRLLQCIAKCLSAVSHLEAVSKQVIDGALQHAIQILGSTDIELVHHATWFLSNAQSRNLRAKEYLQRNKAIENLMFVLHVWSKSSPSKNAPKILIDEILDNILLALINLTNPNVNVNPTLSCQQILNCEKFDALKIFIDLLVSDRPILLYSRVLRLLVNIVDSLGVNALDRCAYVFDSRRKMSYAYNAINLVSRSIESLPNAKAERERELKVLIRNGFNLLRLFTHQNTLLEQLKILRNTSLNPVLFLTKTIDETLAKPLVEFLVELSRDSDLINEWAKNEQIHSIFLNSIKLPIYSEYISNILKRIYFIRMNKDL